MRCFLNVLFAVVLAAPALAETRVALVIGNARYERVQDLTNPVNDAADIARALEGAKFTVTRIADADFESMRRALADFGAKAARADVAVVYFAGHGMEIERQNYLLPIDAELSDARDVAFHAVPLSLLRRAAEPATRLSLVIVDACRDNPFLDGLPSTGRSLAQGLARVSARGQNSLVAFAAKEGTIAEDGVGRNSPYAQALSRALAEPGLEIGKLFRRVRDDVISSTRGRQEPALYGSLSEEDFFFVPPVEASAARGLTLASPAPTALDVPAHAPGGAVDVAFWTAVADSQDPRDFEDYLKQFPNGAFAPLAARRLEQLRAPAKEPAPQPVQAKPDPAPAAVAARPEPEPEPVVEEPTIVATAPARAPAPDPEQPAFTASRAQIRDSQVRLTLLDLDPGPTDGLMGRRTATAIATFQRRVGLTADGQLSRQTFDRLSAKVSAERLAAFYAEQEAQRVTARRAADQRRRDAEAARAAEEAEARRQQAAAAAPEPEPEDDADESEYEALKRRCEWLDNNGNASRLRECIPFIYGGSVISSGGDTETGNPAERTFGGDGAGHK
ncbi:MAG: caspase family protein [Pseudomonadota bacterium]